MTCAVFRLRGKLCGRRIRFTLSFGPLRLQHRARPTRALEKRLCLKICRLLIQSRTTVGNLRCLNIAIPIITHRSSRIRCRLGLVARPGTTRQSAYLLLDMRRFSMSDAINNDQTCRKIEHSQKFNLRSAMIFIISRQWSLRLTLYS